MAEVRGPVGLGKEAGAEGRAGVRGRSVAGRAGASRSFKQSPEGRGPERPPKCHHPPAWATGPW